MKKIFLFAAAMAVALSSCSKNEVTSSVEDNQAISFGTYTGVSVKAVEEVKDDNLQKNGFSIWVRETTATPSYATFLTAEPISYGGTTPAWTATQTYYYPTGSKLDFLAIGNQMSADAGTTDGATSAVTVANTNTADAITFEYTTASTAATQQDLIWSYVTGKSTGAVNFTFKHALSRLSAMIEANTTDTNLTLVIESITFKGIKPTGKFTPSTTPIGVSTSGTAADLALGLVATAEFAGVASPSDVEATAATGALMIIPQAATSIVVKGYWKDENDRTIEDFTTGKTVDLSANSNIWATNTSYVYALSITPKVNAISFTVTSVSGWNGDASTDTPVSNS